MVPELSMVNDTRQNTPSAFMVSGAVPTLFFVQSTPVTVNCRSPSRPGCPDPPVAGGGVVVVVVLDWGVVVDGFGLEVVGRGVAWTVEVTVVTDVMALPNVRSAAITTATTTAMTSSAAMSQNHHFL